MQVWSVIANAVGEQGACALITQLEIQGSAPREAGARMVVMPNGTFTGTIGGGALEWRALALAQSALRKKDPAPQISRHALGPELGQCCGGVSRLMVEVFTADRRDEISPLAGAEQAGTFVTDGTIAETGVVREIIPSGNVGNTGIRWNGADSVVETFGHIYRQIYLFGAGHVGRALILALAPLPFDVVWIDPRDDAFPGAVPGNVKMVRSSDPAAELSHATDGSFVLAITHSHALDLDLVQTALKSGRFGYVGVIGSATKRARFVSRMRKAGLAAELIDKLVCPIGAGSITSKQPAVIAVGVAAELLLCDELVKTGQKPVQFSLQEVTLSGG